MYDNNNAFSRWLNAPQRNSLPGVFTTPVPSGWGLEALQTLDSSGSDQNLPPLLNDLVDEICYAIPADRLMVETLALGACALAVQGLHDQRRPNCAPSPCSLFVLSLADTSVFKTTITRMLFQPMHDLETEEAAAIVEGAADERAEKRTWEIRLKACEKAMAKAWNEPQEMKSLQEMYKEILGCERKDQLPSQLIYEDTTWPALMDGMYRHSPSVALVSDEASAFFSGPLVAFLAKLDKAWDGARIIVDRKTSDSFQLDETRLSLILALQNRPFRKFIESKGIDAAELGFLPRLLVARSGKVDRRGMAGRKGGSQEARHRYHAWATKLLKRYIEKKRAGDFARTTLPMSAHAEAQWIATFEWLAQAVQPGGCFEPFDGYVAKCGENIARIAVIFQMLDDVDSTEVSLVNMRRAILACKRYTEQYIEIFGSMYFPIVQQDAEQVRAWFRDYHQRTGYMQVSTRIFRQYCWGGREFRHDKKRVDAVLEYLEVEGVIARGGYGSRKYIYLSPNHFGIGSLAVSTLGTSGLFQHGPYA
jgi:hypothetical protein